MEVGDKEVISRRQSSDVEVLKDDEGVYRVQTVLDKDGDGSAVQFIRLSRSEMLNLGSIAEQDSE